MHFCLKASLMGWKKRYKWDSPNRRPTEHVFQLGIVFLKSLCCWWLTRSLSWMVCDVLTESIRSVSFLGQILKMAMIWEIIPKLLLLSLVYTLLVPKISVKSRGLSRRLWLSRNASQAKAAVRPWLWPGLAWPGPRLEAGPCTLLFVCIMAAAIIKCCREYGIGVGLTGKVGWYRQLCPDSCECCVRLSRICPAFTWRLQARTLGSHRRGAGQPRIGDTESDISFY
jgi:hypothetical protein